MSIASTGLRIQDENTLVDLSGLDNVEVITDELYMSNTHGVGNISNHFDSLRRARSIFIDRFNGYEIGGFPVLDDLTTLKLIGYTSGPQIKTVTGFPNVIHMDGDVQIQNYRAMTEFSALPNIETIGGNLQFYRHYQLQGLSSFSNLKTVGGYVQIDYNIALQDISGFSKLETVGGDLRINSNSAVHRINGFESLVNISGNLQIYSNNKLTDIDGLRNLERVSFVTLPFNIDVAFVESGFCCTYMRSPSSSPHTLEITKFKV